MGITRQKMMAPKLAFVALVLTIGACVGSSDLEEVTLLQDAVEESKAHAKKKAYDPSVDAKHMAEVHKISDFKTMSSYISKRMAEVQKEQLARDFDGSNEEIAIGNTLKNMEAKHAVEAELNSEVKINCEVGSWGKFSKCSKTCDGGTMERKRTITKHPKNGGLVCPPLQNSIDCNTDSCASEVHQRRQLRRKLTKAEKMREMAVNDIARRTAMRSKTVKSMQKKMRKYMRAVVRTQTAEVKLPGQNAPRSDESLVRKDLKAAMAKNAVNAAMAGFKARGGGH